MPQTKFIVITGGVLSGLGKGIASASIGKLLSSQYRVVPIKLDGYLNVDPGTMNPIEHGEVFVLDDGGEVDMDFGHYERFLGVTCKFEWNLTMGKVFDAIRQRERRGDYLGKTVQFIPHVVDHIKEHLLATARKEKADVMLVEVGGTVGDLESELYVEAVRQLKYAVGERNVFYVHLTYIPIPSGVNEQKSKPTQQSVALLRSRGIQPNLIIGRCKEMISPSVRRKIAMFCDVPEEAVVTGIDVDNVYKIPLHLAEQGVTEIIGKHFEIPLNPDIGAWEELLTAPAERTVHIAICGKYTKLGDSYASVIEALNHAGAHVRAKVKVHWIETTDIETGKKDADEVLKGIDGVIVPGGFGARGAEGKIAVIERCRTQGIPYLGICYGMQLAVIEYARHVKGLAGANSTEIDAQTPHPVIDLLPEQRGVTDKGATMRLGGHDVRIRKGTQAHGMFGDIARLRFRHRWEVDPGYVKRLEDETLVFSGTDGDGRIMQVLELKGHPFFMGTQAHPELTSRLEAPSPFFLGLMKAAVAREEK